MSTSRNRAAAYYASGRRERGLRFVARMYPARIIGLATGGVAIAPVLWTNGAHPALWLALGLSALVWPHIAYGLGLSSADPYRAELRNLTIDSMIGGAFIALMKFNVLPSTLLLVTLSMDKMAVGGIKLFLRCTLALVAACALVAWATSFPVRLETNMLEVYGSLPHLVVFPMAVGIIAYRMAQQMRFQRRQLEAMSRTDGLSQMLTRQAWEQALAEEFAVSRRTGAPVAVILLDIDKLQGVNEHHGYPAGDEVIRTVATILRNSLGERDVPGRYGGEEFAVLLPGADAARAAEIAERARLAVSSSMLERSARLRGSVSIGVAEVLASDSDFRQSIARAEEALRAAKMMGGNRASRYSALDIGA